ncbi:MAG TPA: peptidoglycan DD-metalloendopeptidase family protein [Myxococcus sp.]|nr:peptidoglycan DD-metalloendopeptidase family protein [Myxococcus sp.]
MKRLSAVVRSLSRLSMAAAATLTLAAAPALAAPTFQLPFTCGETWNASTWSGHNPTNAVDLNFYPSDQEIGKPIRASAPGTVTRSEYSTTSGYGNFIVIDHGSGWTTWYAHLKSRGVAVGAKVTQGQQIGIIGDTSATADLAIHLHYEQRLNGTTQKAVINGQALAYFDNTQTLVSKNCPVTTPAGLIVDSDNAKNDSTKGYIEVSTNWTVSSGTSGYYGTGYAFASTMPVSDAATFWFYLPAAATKTIDAWWTAGTNRSPEAPFIIWNAGGTQLGTVKANQQLNGGKWNTLGTWSFTAGWNKVQLSRWAPEGYVVIADAIQVR